MRNIGLIIAALALVVFCSTGQAAVLSSTTLGCKVPADETKMASLKARNDKVGLERFSQSLAPGACIVFAKGITVGIDEKRLPLACVRLTGDLSCYWVVDALVDPFPIEKGSGGPQGGGRHRH